MAMANNLGSKFGNKVEDFEAPTQLPGSAEQRQAWQARNRAWWESTPMRYDWRESIAAEPGTRRYFEEIDRRFFEAVWPTLPWRAVPFDTLIPFDDLRSRNVLEIGVGQGSHAQLLAPRCGSFNGIDLTTAAAEMTAQRLSVFGLPGIIRQMDAEAMDFADGSFDYIWSWGVIHHSADTSRILKEVHRVLRPGGRCTVMVYFRSWWVFYVCGLLRRLFVQRDKKNLHRIAQGATDGAIARWYSIADWRAATTGLFDVTSISISGLKTELVPLPHSRLKTALLNVLPGSLARLLVNSLHMGSFLVVDMRRI